MKFKTDLKQVKTDFDQINLKIHSAVKRFQLLIDYSESCHICRARRARIPLCCVFTHVCRARRARIPLCCVFTHVCRARRARIPLCCVFTHVCRARRARIPLCCVFTHVCRDRRAHIPLQCHWICPKLIKNKNFLKSKCKCTGV